jgi:hypothetical protein
LLREDVEDWKRLKVGSLVKVALVDPEKTAHLQGDPRHTSIYLGLVRYDSLIGTAAPPPDPQWLLERRSAAKAVEMEAVVAPAPAVKEVVKQPAAARKVNDDAGANAKQEAETKEFGVANAGTLAEEPYLVKTEPSRKA